MQVDLPSQKKRFTALESFAVSLGFWLTLLAACGMYAVLALAPKLVEHSQLQRQASRLQHKTVERQQEVRHLGRLANAIEHDKDFLNRIRANEFSVNPRGSIQIRVSQELGYDARVPQQQSLQSAESPHLFKDVLVQLSSPTRMRKQWGCGMLCLFAVAFLFMNETFFSGKMGKIILGAVGKLFYRYQITKSILDEETCQPTP